MKTAGVVKKRISSFPEGALITYRDFADIKNTQAVALTLSRLVRRGVVKRLGRGKYFVPKKSRFGSLGPSDSQIIKWVVKRERGYVSGLTAYNAMGLTTQVSNVVTVSGSRYNRNATLGKLKLRYVKSRVPVKKENVFLLQLLDAIRDMKKIPDTSVKEIIIKLKHILFDLNARQTRDLISLAKYYRPFVKAMVGAILEEKKVDELDGLKKDINPLTVFKISLSENILPYKKHWNFV